MKRTAGKPSRYEGQRIFKLVDLNPRKENSRAYLNWDLIQDGMTYEEFKSIGGNTRDLRADIDHGRIEMRFEEPDED